MRRTLLALSVLGGTATLAGQSPALPSFEVASIKPVITPPSLETAFMPVSTRLTLPYVSLRMMIGMAYGVPDWQIVNTPEWARTSFFAVNAKPPEGTPETPVKAGDPFPLFLMLRSLLEERFQLKTHVEKRESQTYRLVLARSDGKLGPHMKPTQTDCAAVFAERRASGQPPAVPPFGEPMLCGMQGGFGRILGSSLQTSTLATMLQGQMRAPVTDQTGLEGTFDFELTWTPDQFRDRPAGAGPVQINGFAIDPNGPSLMTALQEQLGLKLESAKEPVDFLVVDSVSPLIPD